MHDDSVTLTRSVSNSTPAQANNILSCAHPHWQHVCASAVSTEKIKAYGMHTYIPIGISNIQKTLKHFRHAEGITHMPKPHHLMEILCHPDQLQ